MVSRAHVRARRAARVVAITTLLLTGAPARPEAHEIPARATVQAFVKPDSTRLRILVRVPLPSMRDVDFPLRGLGYLDLDATHRLLPDLARQWIADYVTLHEGDRPLEQGRVVAARVSLPSDPSFTSYATALAHVTGPPLAAATDLVLEQAMLDVLLEYPIRSPASRFSIDPRWAHLGVRTATVLRFVLPQGPERAFRYDGNPGLVRLDPGWHQAAMTFVRLGFSHILDGLDHLLFVFCLVIPIRRFAPLVAVVTSFTLAHSITLLASAAGLAPRALWFPPLIETLIALSIVYMAFENIVGGGAGFRRRWLVAFGFGLVHGFGFSFALRESLQFAGSHLLTSLLAFNVGVELGQLLVVAVAVPVLAMLFRYVVAERVGTILLSALVAHSAWHWMTARGAQLGQYRFQWPSLDLALAAGLVRALMLLLIVGGAGWALSGVFGKLLRTPAAGDPTGAERPSGA
jgi:hypothetical protein